MRFVLCFLIGTLAVAHADESENKIVLLHKEQWGGRGLAIGSYIIRSHSVERAEIEKVPAWEPGKRDLPLTRDQVVKIAKNAARSDGLPDKLLATFSVGLRPQSESDDELDAIPPEFCRWFFMVRFSPNDQELKIYEIPTYLVTMSGAVANSTLVPRK